MLMELVKVYIIKLKTTLQYKILVNNFIIIAISIILLLLGLSHIYLFVLYIIYIYYIYKKQKTSFLFKTIIIINILIICIYIIRYFLYYDYKLKEIEGIITDIKFYETYNKLTVKKGIFKYLVYDYDIEKEVLYKIGDKVIVKGINKSIDKSYMKMMFDNQKYLYSKGIVSIIQKKEIEITPKTNIYTLKNYLIMHVTKNFNSNERAFIFALVLGDTQSISESIQESIQINGISHLFAISGLHISIITNGLEKIIPFKHKNKIINIFLSIYMFITSFSPSIVRSVLMYYLKQINTLLNLKLSSLDIISITFILMILVNPLYVNMNGFILSFLVSFTFIITSSYLKNYSRLQKSLILSFFSLVITLPLTVNISNNLNIMQIFTNVIFIFLVSYIVLPSTFITFFCPFLLEIYKIIINIFIILNNIFSNIFVINITLPNFNIIEIVLYYIFIYIILKNKAFINKKLIKKYIIVFLLFIFCYYNKANLNIAGEVEFLDIVDGEAVLINTPLNNGVILIDTGTGKNEAVSTYLKKKGIRKIDYLILTHSHLDHNGEAQIILDQIKVNNLVISAYDNSVFTVSKKTNVLRVRKNDKLYLKNIEMEILSPYTKSENDTNDDSIIMSANIGNYKYLFLGDASNKILDNLDCKADIIKGAHHGSKTSASYLFYSKCAPKLVILQTGRTDKYGFPDKETINLLNKLNIKYYQTNKSSTVSIYYLLNRSIIKTHW